MRYKIGDKVLHFVAGQALPSTISDVKHSIFGMSYYKIVWVLDGHESDWLTPHVLSPLF